MPPRSAVASCEVSHERLEALFGTETEVAIFRDVVTGYSLP